MSVATIKKSALNGKVSAIPSKSFAHRILICSALCDYPVKVYGAMQSEDIKATMGCIEALGGKCGVDGGIITVTPIKHIKNAVLDCKESGSTLRFMLAVTAALGGEYTLTGQGRLSERPNGILIDTLNAGGVRIEREKFPITISGKLSTTEYVIDGGVSSQYISGLMLAAPLIAKRVIIRVLGEIKSQGYIDITMAVMGLFGAQVTRKDNVFIVECDGYRSPKEVTVEGDWSNAAFMLSAGILCGRVEVTGLDKDSLQGDRQILLAFKALGADVFMQDNAYIAKKTQLTGAEINVENMIDAAPILAVLCAFANGRSVLCGVDRLRLKESDRLSAIINMVNTLGARAKYESGKLIIEGNPNLKGGVVDGVNDHRIVMSAIVAGGAIGGVSVTDINAVNKSYPTFFADYSSVGGVFYVE